MVDVDSCARYAEEGLCFNVQNNAHSISQLSDDQKMNIFRHKTANEIEKMLNRFSNTIKTSVSAKYDFTCTELKPSSNNNRDQADLYCLLPNSDDKIVIEVKFGSYTDKAPGMKNIEKIFGTGVFTKALSLQTRKQWGELLALEYPNMTKHTHRLVSTLNQAVDSFNTYMNTKNYTLTKSEQNYMEGYLLNNSGSYESRSDKYMRFETNKDGKKIIESVPIAKGVGFWIVETIEGLDMDDDKPRVNIHLRNNVTNIKIRFTLNNKNNNTLRPSGFTIRSKYLTGSPSWNVWITQPNASTQS